MVVKPGSVASLSRRHLSDSMLRRALTATSPSWLVHAATLQSLVSPTSGWGISLPERLEHRRPGFGPSADGLTVGWEEAGRLCLMSWKGQRRQRTRPALLTISLSYQLDRL